MSSGLYELLVWLDRQYPRVKQLAQNSPELASIVCKVLDKYPLLIVQQSFKYAHRISMQMYETEADMPYSYPEFMIRVLNSQCERLLEVYKYKRYPIIVDGFDHAEPYDIEHMMDRKNGLFGLTPFPTLQA